MGCGSSILCKTTPFGVLYVALAVQRLWAKVTWLWFDSPTREVALGASEYDICWCACASLCHVRSEHVPYVPCSKFRQPLGAGYTCDFVWDLHANRRCDMVYLRFRVRQESRSIFCSCSKSHTKSHLRHQIASATPNRSCDTRQIAHEIAGYVSKRSWFRVGQRIASAMKSHTESHV
jgi:hypothetical protein